MTKQELIALLNSKFYKVPTPELIDEKFGIKEYRLFPWVKTATGIYKQYVSFCVENEGTAQESAYWSPTEPLPTPVETFTKKAVDFIKAKVADGTIKYGYLVSSDDTLKKGMAIAITPANAKKDVLIVEDAQGNLSITIL